MLKYINIGSFCIKSFYSLGRFVCLQIREVWSMFGFGFKFGYCPLSWNFWIVSNSVRQYLASLEFVLIFLKSQTWALPCSSSTKSSPVAGHHPTPHHLCSYRILCSVLLGTADNVIWPVLSFQVDTHWGEVKGIKSYLRCIEGAKIWQKQLSPSWMGYPPESSKPVISQHCSGNVCMFVCLCVLCLSVFVFIWICVH